MRANLVRLIYAMLIAFPVVGIGGFMEDAAWGWGPWSFKSSEFTADGKVAAGGSKALDLQVIMAVSVRKVGGVCTENPGGGAEGPARGKPWTFVGSVIASTNVASFKEESNGSFRLTLKTPNRDVQRAFDIYNAENRKKFVNLLDQGGSCPNPKWTFQGFGVVGADVNLSFVKIPALETESGNIQGHAEFLKTNFRDVDVPDLDADGHYIYGEDGKLVMVTVQAWDFAGRPFRYCSRYTDRQGPDGFFADSGLRIYDYNDPVSGHFGEELDVNDNTYKVVECQTWADLNKDPQANLSTFGTYMPDTAAIEPPQDGKSDEGGLVVQIGDPDDVFLVEDPDTGELIRHHWLTATCHQHGKENTGGSGIYSFNQLGPDKKVCDGTDPIPGDENCTGGSQKMDGNYAFTCP